MKRTALLLIVAALFISCGKVPQSTVAPTYKINTGPGPEDFVLDEYTGKARLLVSCSQRRDEEPDISEIYTVGLETNTAEILPRKNTPDSIHFNPHGIDANIVNGKPYLYVISHNDEKQLHIILKYEITREALLYKGLYSSKKFLVSPNDVAVDKQGNLYVSNDMGKRGNFKEQFFKLKRSNVVYYDESSQQWERVVDNLVYANGVQVKNEKVFVATTRSNKLMQFDRMENGDLTNEKVLSKVKGQDNITIHHRNLVFTAHPRIFAFLKHVRSSENKSPSVVYKINLETGKQELIFADDGSRISAASTALIYQGKLYIGQVFEPYLLVVDVD